MSWVIRKANKQDLKSVFALIQEFAEFEQLSNEVTLTVEEFESDGESQLYQCLVAEANGTVVGYGLYYHAYSGFQGKKINLEDIYVVPHMRGIGIGTALYNAVIQETPIGGHVRFACLEWNKKAVEFYNKSGAKNWTEKVNLHWCRFDKAQLRKLAESPHEKVSIPGVCIRKALPTDVPKVYPFTKEFAELLKLDHTQPMSVLEEDGFGDSPSYRCLVAEREADILGYALYYDGYSTFQGRCMYLEELFIQEDARGKGLGRSFLITLAQECVKKRYCKLQFVSEPPAVYFYQKLGATSLTQEQQWIYFMLQIGNT